MQIIKKTWHLNLIPKAQENIGSQIFVLLLKQKSKAAGGHHTNDNHKLIRLSNTVIKKQEID